ncbi:hypothetical protein QTP88_024500 [Uroleucon formosanum]
MRPCSRESGILADGRCNRQILPPRYSYRSESRTKKNGIIFVLYIFEVHCLFGHETGIFYTHPLRVHAEARQKSVLLCFSMKHSAIVALDGRVSRVDAKNRILYFGGVVPDNDKYSFLINLICIANGICVLVVCCDCSLIPFKTVLHIYILSLVITMKSKLFTEFINIGGCRDIDGEDCIFVMDSEGSASIVSAILIVSVLNIELRFVMSTKRKINDYFTKRSKTIDEPQLIPNKVQITSEKISENQDQIESLPHLNDIGIFANRDLTNDEKYCALTKVWVPKPTYKFPLCIINEKRGLKFQYHWLLEFNWLAYSEKNQGVYHKHCVVFAKTGGVGSQPLRKLVYEAFNAWKKALEVFRKHSTCDYHVTSVVKSDILDIFTKKQPSIIETICVDRNVQIQETRKKIVPIIECIILCGRQEIALRRHNDTGKMCVNGIEGKEIFSKKLHLENNQRYKYIGAKIQNEEIAACGDIIQKKIIEKINAAECFSILADETTDVLNKEQLTLCVRYIDDQNNLCEDFLKYVNIDSLTGASLSSAILNGLTSCGVQCDYLFGQGYGGASNMSGKFRGVQAIICEKYPQALYVHCAAHSLNLAVSTASNIKPIRNCFGILKKMYTFFNTPKRSSVILREIDGCDFEPKVKSLKRLCATTWVQRYDAVNDFMELFPFVVAALEIISEWNDSSVTDASMLLKSFDSEFLIALQVIKELAEIVNINLSVKRIAKRQTNRANPFTDSMNNTTCFEAIFSKNQYLNVCEVDSFQNLLEFYSPNINKDNNLAELKIWRTKLLQNQIAIKTALDALRVCCPNLYPNINKLLKILCTLPERLNGLTMLAIHKDVIVTPDEVLDEMAKKPRKLEIVI